jgi:hypothetical protein
MDELHGITSKDLPEVVTHFAGDRKAALTRDAPAYPLWSNRFRMAHLSGIGGELVMAPVIKRYLP